MLKFIITHLIATCYVFGLCAVAYPFTASIRNEKSLPRSYSLVSLFCCGFIIIGSLFSVCALHSIATVRIVSILGYAIVAAGALYILLKLTTTLKKPENPSISLRQYAPLILLAVGALFLAYSPPSFKDELVYHLTIPKQILEQSGFFLELNNIFAYFPALQEMHTLFFEAIGNPILPKILHTYSFIALLILVSTVTRNPLFPIFFGTTASILHTATIAYVDITYTVFTILAILLVQYWATHRSKQLLYSIGILCGGLFSIKYLAYQPVIFIILTLLLYQRNTPATQVLRNLLIVCISTAIIAMPWYLKNYIFTHNPLFPFCYSLFPSPSAISWDAERAGNYMTIIAAYGFPTIPFLNGSITILDYITAPIRACISALFDEHARFDGIIGAGWLIPLLTPFIWLRKNTPGRIFLFGGIYFSLFWIFGSKQIRFFIPALTCFLLALGSMLHTTSHKTRRTVSIALIVGIIINIMLLPRIPNIRQAAAYLIQGSNDESLLSDTVKPYRVQHLINTTTPPESVILLIGTDNLNYYLDRTYISDYIFTTHTVKNALQSHSFASYIYQNHVTHIVLNDRFIWDETVGLPHGLQKRFSDFLENRATLISEIHGYSLYEITTRSSLG